MSYLIDTNVLSELRKPAEKVHAGVKAWADSHAVHDQFLSAVTIFELELGIVLKSRRDGKQAVKLREWLEDQVKPTFEGRILDFDAQVAQAAAQLHATNPRPLGDSFIAATAQVHGLTVVTRNERDFAELNVPYVNPWLA